MRGLTTARPFRDAFVAESRPRGAVPSGDIAMWSSAAARGRGALRDGSAIPRVIARGTLLAPPHSKPQHRVVSSQIPHPQPASAAPAPTPRAGRPIASYLLLAAAAALMIDAVVLAIRYPSLAAAVDSSGLTPEYRGVIRALWIGAVLQPAIIAVILLVAGLRPGSIAKPALVLIALLPLLDSSVRGAFSGSLLASALPAAALLLTLGAVALARGDGKARPTPV